MKTIEQQIAQMEKDYTRIEEVVKKHLEDCWANDTKMSERKILVEKMWQENKFAHYIFEYKFSDFLAFIFETESEIYYNI
ncbi:hypothetical protein CAPN008_01220 [Capnocytophaga canis]|uniref:hypothetical protein n=1 Tax=Capnocytophaga canis TaxID=1848903 RepID=UPI001AD081F7|nr:hypothetical protein [Capnocytophaga canis]GIM60072.1 hypothetical protein CAPN008_01220 [Capnocytophaga canis]